MSRWYIPFLLGVLFVCTACPHAFGKGGTIDRAVLKDIEEYSRRPRLTDCGPATLREICLPETLKECEQQCLASLQAPREEEEW